jgi:RNA polymerase sigma-70 factor (sigma-E family)
VDEFDDFFIDQYGKVLRTVALIAGDRNRAEDATQEAFMQAFRKWRTVRAMARPGSWVLVVAINADRRRWRRTAEEQELVQELVAAEDHAAAVTTAIAVHEALARLTTRQRAAVVLRYLSDLPVKDIADALGCAEGTVRATLHQALSKLQIDLEEVSDEP